MNRGINKKSVFLFLFKALIKMSLELFGLLMYTLEYFIGIGIDIEVHFFVIVSRELIGIVSQHIVDNIIVFQIVSLPRYDMHHEVLDGRLLSGVLYMNGG